MYARRRGRRFSARSAAASSELQALEYYLARNLFSWIRADYVTLVDWGGGDIRVGAFRDKVALVSEGAVAPNARSVDPAHAFAQLSGPSQVAAVSTSSLLGNREVADFAQNGFYDSTLSAAGWTFSIDGTGFQAWASIVPRGGKNSILFATGQDVAIYTGSERGLYAQVRDTPGNEWLGFFGCNGTSRFIGSANNGSTTMTTGVGRYVSVSYKEGVSPEWTSYNKSALVLSGDSTAAPSASAPASTMRIGNDRDGGTTILDALVGDMMFATRVDAALFSRISRYFSLRYGLS